MKKILKEKKIFSIGILILTIYFYFVNEQVQIWWFLAHKIHCSNEYCDSDLTSMREYYKEQLTVKTNCSGRESQRSTEIIINTHPHHYQKLTKRV